MTSSPARPAGSDAPGLLGRLEADRAALLRAARALGPALGSVEVFVEPALARSAQAEANLYGRIEREFGLLTSGEAGKRLGSRSTAPRNLATNARARGQVAALTRGSRTLFPGFQFGDTGPLPVMADLLALAAEHERSESGVIQWLCSPTTTLEDPGAPDTQGPPSSVRPVDMIHTSPDRVLAAASLDWAVVW